MLAEMLQYASQTNLAQISQYATLANNNLDKVIGISIVARTFYPKYSLANKLGSKLTKVYWEQLIYNGTFDLLNTLVKNTLVQNTPPIYDQISNIIKASLYLYSFVHELTQVNEVQDLIQEKSKEVVKIEDELEIIGNAMDLVAAAA